jgi:hypothetical protein
MNPSMNSKKHIFVNGKSFSKKDVPGQTLISKKDVPGQTLISKKDVPGQNVPGQKKHMFRIRNFVVIDHKLFSFTDPFTKQYVHITDVSYPVLKFKNHYYALCSYSDIQEILQFSQFSQNSQNAQTVPF